MIGTAENSAVALYEIYEWTGIKVDTFVNFLKLPGERISGEARKVTLSAVDARRTKERREVRDTAQNGFAVPEELKDLQVSEAYQVSLATPLIVASG